MTSKPIMDDGGVTPMELCEAMYRAELGLRSLRLRLREPTMNFTRVIALCKEGAAWADGLFANLEWMLIARGYEPPTLDYRDDPDAHLFAWCQFFDKVRETICADAKAFRLASGQTQAPTETRVH